MKNLDEEISIYVGNLSDERCHSGIQQCYALLAKSRRLVAGGARRRKRANARGGGRE